MSPETIRWIRAAIGGAIGLVTAALLGFYIFFPLTAFLIFDPNIQSAKLIAVWLTLEPLPILLTNPLLFLGGTAIIGVGHGLVFAGIVKGLPEPLLKRGVVYGLVLWALLFIFLVFFTPLNLLGAPLTLASIVIGGFFVVAPIGGDSHLPRLRIRPDGLT